MKSKYIIPIILAFTLLFGNVASYSRQNDDGSTMFFTSGRSFEIMAYKSSIGGYEYKKPSPLMTYDDGELTFYEFEKVTVDGQYRVIPKLDKDGYPIKIDKKDKDIINKLFVTLNPIICAKIENTKLNINAISIGIFDGRQWMFNTYKRELKEDGAIRMDSSYTDKVYPYGSISIMDNNYNFEVYEYYGVMHQRVRAITINPDYCRYLSDYPGLSKMDEALYSRDGFGQGYLWAKVDSNQYKMAGKDYDWHKPAIISKDGLFINLSFLTDVLFAPYTFDGKTCTIKRLFRKQSRNETILIELQLIENSKKAYLNGQEVELSLEPFDTKDAFYVPLLDVCRLLRANCHTSRYDGSILIARFFAPMND
ncbi:MAG: hypothetical protein GX421_06180 [Caldisericales bacterium]|nr:hypothetical protein [Caldisericales bacterium]